MGVAEIVAAIERDAAAEVARLEEESRQRAEALAAEAARRAAAVVEEIAAPAERAAQEEAERLRAAARAEARRALREAREETFLRAHALARRLLATVRDDAAAYEAVFSRLLDEALAALPDARVVRVDPRDAQLAAAALARRGATARIEASLESAGGLELDGEDGRVLRNTFEVRLERAEPYLRALAAREE